MRRVSLLLILLGLSTGLFAQDGDRIADLSSKGARVVRASNAGRLTSPSNDARPDIVSSLLRGRHDPATVDSLVLAGENVTARGAVHVRFRQRVNGLDVYGTYVRATLTPAGEMVTLIENLASTRNEPVHEQIGHRDALATALERRYRGAPTNLPEIAAVENTVVFARGSRFAEDPTVTRVALPMASGRLRVGYLVETWDLDNQLWHTIVGGNGRIVFEELRTANDSYKIFPLDLSKPPGYIVVNGPGGILLPTRLHSRRTASGPRRHAVSTWSGTAQSVSMSSSIATACSSASWLTTMPRSMRSPEKGAVHSSTRFAKCIRVGSVQIK